MADPAVVFIGAVFCACYMVFLIIVLAVGILSRLDPVIIKTEFCGLFSSFCMDCHMINMDCLLIKTRYTREEDMHLVWD